MFGIELPHDPEIPLLDISWGKKKNPQILVFAKIYVPYIHCSIIQGGQDTETIKMPFDRGLEKKAVVHVHN